MKSPTTSRPKQVRKSVFDAVNRWNQNREERVHNTQKMKKELSFPTSESVLQSMPRREQLTNQDERQLWLPTVESLVFKTSFWRSVGRLFTWFGMLISIILGNLSDRILRRDSVERRAIRLREVLERAGGTFVKLGQQVAMRIDLVPWAYCVELSKMLDQMLPFPTEQALKAVEKTIGRPWQDVFDVFDPKPIGSASMACVYQAKLKDGTKVVVKIRRPGVAELFRADLKVLDWVAELAEFLTIIRPGFTRNLRAELRDILMEELDFRREGRFQDIFRRNAPPIRQGFFHRPECLFRTIWR